MPAMEEILEVRAAYFAEDLEVHDGMCAWSHEQLEAFFESGGKIAPASKPPDSAAAGSTAAAEASDDATASATGAFSRTDATASNSVASDGLEAELATLSIKVLKARCASAGLSTDDCLARSDLVRRAMEAATAPQTAADAPTPSVAAPSAEQECWWVSVPTKEMKRRLESAGVDTSACFERSDFEALAQRHADADEGESTQDALADYWTSYTAKELRRLLTDRSVSTSGCLDRSDLLQAANAHRQVLLAPITVPSTTATAAAGDARMAELDARRKAGLEALGGVVHGGYQMDMFGTKRGRCVQNPRCFRYLPANVKMNGCAMPGLRGVTCSRCGFQNIEHEDLGRWEEGDPHLVDENGDGWRFVNAYDGVRKEKMQPPGPQPGSRRSG